MIGREFANSKALLTPFNNIWEHSTEWYIYKVSQHGILQIVYEHLLRSQFSVSSFFFQYISTKPWSWKSPFACGSCLHWRDSNREVSWQTLLTPPVNVIHCVHLNRPNPLNQMSSYSKDLLPNKPPSNFYDIHNIAAHFHNLPFGKMLLKIL